MDECHENTLNQNVFSFVNKLCNNKYYDTVNITFRGNLQYNIDRFFIDFKII